MTEGQANTDFVNHAAEDIRCRLDLAVAPFAPEDRWLICSRIINLVFEEHYRLTMASVRSKKASHG